MKVKEFLRECTGINSCTIRCDFNDRDRADLIDGKVKPSEYFKYNKHGIYGVYENDSNTEFFIPKEYLSTWYVGDIVQDIPNEWLELDIFCVDLRHGDVYIIAMPPKKKNAIVEDYKARKLTDTSCKIIEVEQLELMDLLK